MTNRIAAVAFVLVSGLPCRGLAEDNLDSERMLVDVIQAKRAVTKPPVSATPGALEAAPTPTPTAPELAAHGEGTPAVETPVPDLEIPLPDQPQMRPEGRWAGLPQIGYSPERGPNAGIKFTDRDFFGLTVDVAATYALKKQRTVHAAVVAPNLLGGHVIGMLSADLGFDPTKEFFGLGSNDVGPDALSTNAYERNNVVALVAAPLTKRFSVALSAGYNDVRIRRGDLEDDRPSTVDLFPNLPGIRGGQTNPVSLALIFNSREELARPTRGWNVIAKVQHVNRSFDNDFQYTRYAFDGSYLYPLLTRRQVIGIRVGGEYIDGKRGEVPFYELASLGGSRDLRGYFQDRFLGRSKLVLSAEYRLGLLNFDFFDIWRVKIDGVGFVDAGRVFIDHDELSSEFRLGTEFFRRLVEDYRYSYGGGVRIALGDAILARIDAGFSKEETGLVYLTFGHTF